jgi:hypothetical protein
MEKTPEQELSPITTKSKRTNIQSKTQQIENKQHETPSDCIAM